MIEGYASVTSVAPSAVIQFCVRITESETLTPFKIDFYRKGKSEEKMEGYSVEAYAKDYPIPADAASAGCGWPSAYELIIPDSWQTGVYIARLTSELPPVEQVEQTDVIFIVKPAAPGKNSKILFQSTVNTFQAYNNWGGGCYYSTPQILTVSFDRPEAALDDPETGNTFQAWESHFIEWLEDQGIEVEYCTNIDIHQDAELLSNYQLLLSVGHDEYWSEEMRSNVETFIASGGNVAFFSGNVCYYKVYFKNNERQMDGRWTWGKQCKNAENSLTGVGFEYLGAAYPSSTPDVRTENYFVLDSSHWVFEGTGLNDGDPFGGKIGSGKSDGLLGYETDAVEEDQGTPEHFIKLAHADLTNWPAPGQATMGIYTNNGTVFTASTTGWALGLIPPPPQPVSQITHNVLQRLAASPINEYSAGSPDEVYHYAIGPWQLGPKWTDVGAAFYAYARPMFGAVPVYQFYALHTEPEPVFTRYYYSTNPQDENPGWTCGRIAFYAYAEQAPGSVAVYRFSPQQSEGGMRYYYSVKPEARDGWAREKGIAFYAFTAPGNM